MLAASQLVLSVLAFLTQRVVLSTFTKDENGAFFLVQQIGALVLTCFVEAGMTTVTMGLVVRAPDRADTLIATLFKLRLVLWCAATFVLVGLGAWYGVDTIPLFMLFAVSAFFTAKIQIQRSVLEIRRRAVSDQIPSSLAAIAEAALLLALVWFDREHLSALSVLLWMTIAAAPGFCGLLLLDAQWKRLRAPFDAAAAREIVQASFPVFIVVLMQQIHTASDAVCLDVFATKADVGVFGAAFRVIGQSMLFVGVLSQAMFPTLTRLHTDDLEECKRYALQSVRAIMLFALVFALFASSVMPWIIFVSSGETYTSHLAEFFWLTWAIVPAFVQSLLLTFNTAITWQRRNYAIFTVLVVVSLVGNLTLTPLYQVFGAIFTKFLALAASCAVALVVLGEFSGVRAVARLAGGFVAAVVLGGAAAWAMLLHQPVATTLEAWAKALFLRPEYASLLRFVLTIPIFALLTFGAGLLTWREAASIARRIAASTASLVGSAFRKAASILRR